MKSGSLARNKQKGKRKIKMKNIVLHTWSLTSLMTSSLRHTADIDTGR